MLLDRLLTQSVTGLIAEKLITLEEMAIDGTKVRAWAGRGSMSKRKRLERIEKAVADRVAELKSELDKDPGEPERRRKRRALQAAQERARRVERAHQKLAELVQEQAARAKTHAKEEAEKGEPKVSVSDPEARSMRLADGAVAPAWNVQVATANGFVMAIDPTDRRKDSGLAPGLVEKIAERCGRAPRRLLADTTAITQPDIVELAERYPSMTVYSPPPPERPDVTAETLRKRRWKRRHEPSAVQAWRARMASEEGQQTYRRRKLTERAHGIRQEPWHVPVSGAQPGESPRRLRTASAGAQPLLGQHPASPHCCGGSDGDTGDRMTTARRNGIPEDIRDNIHGVPGPIGLANIPSLHILR